MKKYINLYLLGFQLPVVLLFSLAFWTQVTVEQGKDTSAWMRDTVYPKLRSVSGFITDKKFSLRGPQSPKNKIAIIEVDNLSIDQFGRWPWHRDVTARLIQRAFDLGAKVVGIDIVFSEPDYRVPNELMTDLKKAGVALNLKQYETDFALAQVVQKNADHLVLGWFAEHVCSPLFEGKGSCDVFDPENIKRFPVGVEKFGIQNPKYAEGGSDFQKFAIGSFPTMTANLPMYNDVAKYAGFLTSSPDPDGVIRRVQLAYFGAGAPYPSLALSMATAATGEGVAAEFTPWGTIAQLKFEKSGTVFPVSPLGAVEVNFRGGSSAFKAISAYDVIQEGDKIEHDLVEGRSLAGLSKSEILKDAIVLIGVTATGVNDMRNFPYEENVPGVLGHANVIDNILGGDALIPSSLGGFKWGSSSFWILVLMSFFAIAIGVTSQRLEAIPAFGLFLAAFLAFGFFDLKLLFIDKHTNWNTGLFYFEMGTLCAVTFLAKYIAEERSKKVIRSAFSKYVAPAVVNRILEDPEKLMLGGERRELSILFSDIRGFTTFSEKMDAKALSTFLNDYLGIMTNIVFESDGTLDKYIGDAVMAFWGAPLDQPSHALLGTQAAVKMMKALHANQERFKKEYGVDVDIGIGLNTGFVSVGNMGCENNFEYTAIGDHVNLASRLEGLTKYYGVSIVTSRFTLDQMVSAGSPLPPHRVLDFVKVKGKANAIELIQLLDKDLPQAALVEFEKARVAYSKCQWDEAQSLFEAVQKQMPEDGPTEMYLERIADFRKAPPEAGWDGAWVMTSK